MDTNCEDCQGPGAEYLVDPYSKEMFDEDIYIWICDGCYAERCAAV